MASSIRLDVSRSGIVIYCRKCGHWAAFRFTKPEAWAVALRHEADVHPDERYQRIAAEVRATRVRHAESDAPIPEM